MEKKKTLTFVLAVSCPCCSGLWGMAVGSTGVHQTWTHVGQQGKFQEIFVQHELVMIL